MESSNGVQRLQERKGRASAGPSKKCQDDDDFKEEDEEDELEEIGGISHLLRGPHLGALCKQAKKGCSYATTTLELVVKMLQKIGETWKGIWKAVQGLVQHCERRVEWWAVEDSRRDVEGHKDVAKGGFGSIDSDAMMVGIEGRSRKR
ncbi:hypothetical protein BU17DRAFT_66593 [Hysterangium stoloniferum]|nr:hypothetical protein BU17DRAFT_66593 [Hysterangium stoloniferum]